MSCLDFIWKSAGAKQFDRAQKQIWPFIRRGVLLATSIIVCVILYRSLEIHEAYDSMGGMFPARNKGHKYRAHHIDGSIADPIWKPANGATFTDSEVADIIRTMSKNGNLRDSTKYAVDLGANDGSGPSERLFTELGYPGLLVEGDEEHLPALTARFPSPDVEKVIAFITPKSAVDLLKKVNAPFDVHYLKIDMDADDCATLVAILEAGYRPRVLQAEVTYEIPFPYAFGVYPLSRYAYKAHYGFQSCSLTLLHSLLQHYGYSLVCVGGTKDAIYVQEKSMDGLLELDMTTALNTFWNCCIASANPSNSKQLEVEAHDFGFDLGPIPPSQWFQASFTQFAPRDLMRSIHTYLDAACLLRASNAGALKEANGKCPFKYILSGDPEAAADEFIRENIKLLNE